MVSRFMKRVADHFGNEMAVVTPNGKILSHELAEGLRKWRALPAAQRTKLDDLGNYNPALDAVPPPGGLILKVYARGLVPEGAGRYRIYKTRVTRSCEPGIDFLWLTEAEWRSLVPARLSEGERLEVPRPLVDRICRRALLDLVREGGEGQPRQPEEVLAREMHLTVEEVTPAAVRLRLQGSARLATHDGGFGARGKQPKIDTYQLLGFLSYDPKQQVFTRFDVVAFSPTGHFDEVHKRVLALGIALELTRGDKPADRVAPSYFSKNYFNSDR